MAAEVGLAVRRKELEACVRPAVPIVLAQPCPGFWAISARSSTRSCSFSAFKLATSASDFSSAVALLLRKTTLLMAVGGLLRPTSGSVIVEGRPIWEGSEASRAAYRSNTVGFVFQDPHLLPWLNARDNIAIAVQGRASMGEIDQCLEGLGLGDRAEHLPGELSTGERRRVALARAVVNKPAVLLADEPTSHLDQESAASVLQILSSWCNEGGTVVMVNHGEQSPPCRHRFVDLLEGRLHEQEMVEGKAEAT